jgi:Baseplate J-like protein
VPLPTPILDDRSYQQLRDELVRRVPVYAPEWTDHNASDPGIALLELFAFLGENLLFRFNQIPESTYLEFLRLLDVPLRPAVPSRALVELTTKTPAGELVELASELKAGALSFETRTELHAWPVGLVAVARAASPLPETEEAQAFAARALDALELADDEEAVFYVNRLVPADPSAPDAQPVDFRAAVDGTLWAAVVGADAAPAAKQAQLALLRDGILNVGFVPDEPVDSAAEVDPCDGLGTSPRSRPLTWQISTGRIEGETPRYRTLAVVGDTTAGLSRQGVVRLRLPRELANMGDFPPPDPDLGGTGDLPPELEDADTAGKVLFWLRAFREDRSLLGRVLWVGANVTESEQTRRAAPEFLGTGTGDADQSYPLVHRPVIDGTLVVEVEGAPDRWEAWTPIDGFHGAGEDDNVYVVDLDAGLVRFGNGVRGRAPQIGQRIRATAYRYGGGRVGNAAAGAISKLEGPATVKARNPLAARGGADSESVAEALERVPAVLRQRDRAVTSGDFRELALVTPGAGVGRAECLARFHPRTRITDAAGVVSVVVWPREDPQRPNAPIPDRTLLRAVCEWLDARRLVTTELYVIPPTYRRVAVSVGLAVKPGFGVEAVRRWVELAVRQYLAPLPPFGPDGGGWPLGRRVHGPELEAAALQVEGVEFLEGLLVASLAPDGVTWVEGPVQLALDEVPELAELTVVAGTPLPPGESIPAPEPERRPIPVPTIKDVC